MGGAPAKLCVAVPTEGDGYCRPGVAAHERRRGCEWKKIGRQMGRGSFHSGGLPRRRGFGGGWPPLTVSGWMRSALIACLLEGLESVESVLEVGVGEGAFGVRLARRYRYVGLELDGRSLAVARERFERAGVGTLVHGDIGALSRRQTFDLVFAIEVLEHHEDDVGALRSWRARLRSRGWLILTVPACPDRYGRWDEKAGHYRRYARKDLHEALRTAGFEPLSIQAYGYPLGNLLERARNLLAAFLPPRGSMADRTGASGRLLQPPDRLGWLTQAVGALGSVLQRRSLESERGIGLVALARTSE